MTPTTQLRFDGSEMDHTQIISLWGTMTDTHDVSLERAQQWFPEGEDAHARTWQRLIDAGIELRPDDERIEDVRAIAWWFFEDDSVDIDEAIDLQGYPDVPLAVARVMADPTDFDWGAHQMDPTDLSRYECKACGDTLYDVILAEEEGSGPEGSRRTLVKKDGSIVGGFPAMDQGAFPRYVEEIGENDLVALCRWCEDYALDCKPSKIVDDTPIIEYRGYELNAYWWADRIDELDIPREEAN